MKHKLIEHFLRKLAKPTSVLLLALFVSGLFVSAPPAHASSAVLSLSPSTGTFVVDSTFNVSIYLDTQGQSINTIELNIAYPPDKLQLVSSSTGKSIIGIWTSLPKYDNAAGTLSLVGGIPNGIVVGKGLITTLTFRVRAVGSAIVKFDNSRVLLNDGSGTEVLTQSYNSVYDLVLPPPAGPVVASSTHPDQTKWYDNADASLTWADDNGAADGYSYVVNDQPIDTPDDISEGAVHSVTYHNLPDGRNYFHIKALRNGQWGGVTHFALNVDTSQPADFKIEIIPSSRTSRQQPVIQFATTDAFSGLDHYEVKIVSLNKAPNAKDQSQLFIEAQSPYVPDALDYGSYDVIVRAFDKAGNVREVTQRLEISTAVLSFIGTQGFAIKSNFVLPWYWVWLILALLLTLAGFIAYRVRRYHNTVHMQAAEAALPDELQSQMEELQKYRARYGKIAVVLFMALSFGLSSAHKSLAADQQSVLAPPVITTISKNITNNEIFYIGGKNGLADSEVIIYLQNSSTTATVSKTVTTDKNGEWFYRWDGFLEPGDYVVWAQTKQDAQLSPPSPQINLSVESAAVQFGATRFSYSTIYLLLFLITLLILLGLIIYIIYHLYHGKRKHKLLLGQVAEAEASVRRGFAVLNRDLEAELDIIRKARLSKELSAEELKREQQLLSDMKEIEQYLSKEIWDIEDTEIRV